jgi:hypothetical protein
MQSFDSKLAFDLLYESQISNGNCFRPAIVSQPPTVLKRLFNPLTVCSLKICQIRKSAQCSQAYEIDYRVAIARLLNLTITAVLPL